jgi:glutathione S-transferase
MGGIGPMFGQVGFFNKFAGGEYEDKRPLQRYVAESKRLLGVMEARPAGRQWIMDDGYTRKCQPGSNAAWHVTPCKCGLTIPRRP